MSYEVYFEAQDKETSLCGQHAINNLLQGPYFTAIDLGSIGSRLDEQESNLYSINEDEKTSDNQMKQDNFFNTQSTTSYLQTRERIYSNVSMEGLFSVEVLITALKQLEIAALPLSHPTCSTANEHPDREQGFIFYCMSHWIAYRKINDVWYDLNSQSNYLLIDPQPVRITDFFLSAQMSKLQDKGFQVFVIRGKFPSLARYAPRSDDLKGTYAWYQSADIKSHVELDKQSRQKQQQEQQIKTRQLMLDDPQQYNALMMNGNINPKNNVYSLYEQQQQYLAMQQYQTQQYSDNNGNDNGIMAKMGNPFSKLKKIYQEKTKEIKHRMSIGGSNDAMDNDDPIFANALEKAKQESLKMAENKKPQSKVKLAAMNSPQIAVFDHGTQKNEDVDLAMALSASMAGTGASLKNPQNESVKLEFEMTDHKPKIIKQQQQQHDFLDLFSMDDVENNNAETSDMDLDDDDPFSSLIRQYSDVNKNNNNNTQNMEILNIMDDNAGNGINLMDFGDLNTNTETVDFGNDKSNDFNTLFGDKEPNISKDTHNHNPLLSPSNNTNNGGTSGDNNGHVMAQRMEDDLWRMLEKSLSHTDVFN